MKTLDLNLYFITDSTGFSEKEFLKRVELALQGKVTLVQLREKNRSTREYIKIARKLLGPDKIIGATAKTVPQAIEAYEQGADYLGVGAIYPTTTKVKTVLTSTDTLREICKAVPIPANAIGGLNKENIHVLKGIPIAGICVVSAIMKEENPKQAAAELREAVKKQLGIG